MQGQPDQTTQREYYNTTWTATPMDRLASHEVLRLGKILVAYATIMDDLRYAERQPAICDLGCGRGWLSAELARFGAVTAVDFSELAVQQAAQRWPHVRFTAGDVQTWRSPDLFDVVVSSEVIEHVPNKAAFAATVAAILRPGGYLILTTPVQQAKTAYFTLSFRPQPIEEWLSPRQLQRLFASHFVVQQHETFLFEFSHAGLRRLTNSAKLLRACRRMGLGSALDGVRSAGNLGLYQIMLARRRTDVA